jgi:2-dehydropantoate 2-reductase
MRIGVIGAGAMGSLYGGLLARAGREVVLYDRWVEHIAAIRERGLELGGIGGELRIRPARATADWAEIGKLDVALVLVDANSTAEAAEVVAPRLKPGGFALTLQNGVGNVEALGERLGRERVLGGLSYHSAALERPGRVLHTHAGATWLGELDGARSARVLDFARTLEGAGFKPTVVDDIVGFIWTKFVHNAAINGLSAVAGLRVGEIGADPNVDAFQSRIIEEALAVIEAKGVALVEPDPMGAIKAFCKVKFNKASMLQHVEAGKRTEIDALNGAIVREGRRLGVPTPFNEALTLMVKALEDSRRRALHEPPVDWAAREREAQAKYGKP